ncbi:MAG TPA: KpsF/GutQ family sugar-phosphate isomerase [Phycisphaerae bacterium]|jgi:arabinose-5-phosphate isomerase
MNRHRSQAVLEMDMPETPHHMSDDEILRCGQDILNREAAAIRAAAEKQGTAFVKAVRMIAGCTGRVGVTGMGKAGLIGTKIQATLASTATPSYFLHAAEALHGDLGMVRANDVLIALSRSGETAELAHLIRAVKQVGARVILLTGKTASRCARLCDLVIDIGQEPEACPLGLAPSSSTAAMLAAGDALALTVMSVRAIVPEQYAAYHPGGALGRSLMKVEEIMRTGRDCPQVDVAARLSDCRAAIGAAPLRAGAACVVDHTGTLVGIFTLGDLFRLVEHLDLSRNPPIAEVMTRAPKTARVGDRVADALATMRQHRIDELPVVDADGRLAGLIDIQDLLAHGFSVFDDP